MMGKKKSEKKTKELSVALAESSLPEEAHTPRKRGRPRKIIEKNEEQIAQDFQDSKKAKLGEEKEEEKEKKLEEKVGQPSKSNKEEELSKQLQGPRRSSARRKSKPRKSS